MSNEELVTRIQNGEDAMIELYEQVRQLLRSVCWKYRGYAEMDDLEQEAVLSLYAAVDGYDPAHGTTFSTYLVRCARNHLIRYLSGNPQTVSLDEPQNEDGCTLGDMLASPEDLEQDVIDGVDDEQLSRVLWSTVDDLGDRPATVIRKYYKDGKTVREIGDDLGESYSKVRYIRERALHDLKRSRRLRDEVYSDGLRGNGVQRFHRTWTSSTEATAIRLAERG